MSLFQHGISLAQASTSLPTYPIPPEWVLLDSQSTFSIFNNDNLVLDIRPSDHPLHGFTNGGELITHDIATISNLGTVWFNRNSVANIFSLAQVRKHCRVTMDTGLANSITVHKADGSTIVFVETDAGLYVHDTGISPSVSPSGVTFLQTVTDNKTNFTPREVANADRARALYRALGRPSQHSFEAALQNNLILNCPVTVDDAKRAVLIYGPDVPTLKGRTTHGPSQPHIPNFTARAIPILAHHPNITLCIDFFYVQGFCFFHAISRALCYRTVFPVPDRGAPTILSCLRRTLLPYESRGFTVTSIIADQEFECARDSLAPIHLDTVPPDSHVGDVERSIRTIKERSRATVHGLPFKRLPKLMVNELVLHSTRCLNQLPAENGVSDIMSPHAIITGRPNPDYRHLQLEFGSYVQVYEYNPNTNNTMRARTTGAITLTSTDNAGGHMFFMSLATGKRISRGQWTELPIPEEAILRVEELARIEGQPMIQQSRLIVEWRPEQPFEDSDDPDYIYDTTGEEDEPLEEADYDWDELDENENTVIDNVETVDSSDPEDDQEQDVDEGLEIDYVNLIDEEPITFNEEFPGTDNADHSISNHDEQGAEEHNSSDQGAEVANDSSQTTAGQRYNLRPNRERNYEHRLDHKMDQATNSKSYELEMNLFHTQVAPRAITGLVLTQMSAAAGIKLFGEPAKQAMLKEFKQLDDKQVFTPRHAHELTPEQKKEALRAVNLIKEKRTGDLKGRTCADGSKQRGKYSKEETASPTVSNNALVYTLLVDAKERRDVAFADVEGAYLNARMKGFVVMKLTGEAVDIMLKVNPKYVTFAVEENGKKVLYLQLEKALYGCVQSALLWYELFSSTLVNMGFELNPYDPCVANKIVDGKQCTIVWYVDDVKISHVDADVVTKVILAIEEKFGKMTVSRGKKHTFLGMQIDLNDDCTVTLSMQSHLQEALNETNIEITKTATSPAQKNLFIIDENSETLGKKEADNFHSIVAKLLYISLRTRPDILLATSFLCTRVSNPTKQDQRKLQRLLEYIHGTVELKFTIGADDLSKVRTWVDASYATHSDMRSHTGGLMSFGTGGITCKSSKQKLNTKSSTEAEVVGVSDYISNTIWLRMFLEKQGITIESNILEQDNESAIRLETNGRQSAGKQSRHIDIRYFFLKDRLKSENIQIKHCPTELMIADFFTKPLQGTLFTKFRAVILGHMHTTSLTTDALSQSEERVENTENVEDDIPIVQATRQPPAVHDVDGQEEYSVTPHNDKSGEWCTVTKKKRKTNTLTGRTKYPSRKQDNDRTTLIYNYPILTN
jgi:hypothetical protein